MLEVVEVAEQISTRRRCTSNWYLVQNQTKSGMLTRIEPYHTGDSGRKKDSGMVLTSHLASKSEPSGKSFSSLLCSCGVCSVFE